MCSTQFKFLIYCTRSILSLSHLLQTIMNGMSSILHVTENSRWTLTCTPQPFHLLITTTKSTNNILCKKSNSSTQSFVLTLNYSTNHVYQLTFFLIDIILRNEILVFNSAIIQIQWYLGDIHNIYIYIYIYIYI